MSILPFHISILNSLIHYVSVHNMSWVSTFNIFVSFNILSYRHVYRYQAVLLRDRFDQNAKLPDMRKAAQLLKEGEEELFLKQHPIPKKCKNLRSFYWCFIIIDVLSIQSKIHCNCFQMIYGLLAVTCGSACMKFQFLANPDGFFQNKKKPMC